MTRIHAIIPANIAGKVTVNFVKVHGGVVRKDEQSNINGYNAFFIEADASVREMRRTLDTLTDGQAVTTRDRGDWKVL